MQFHVPQLNNEVTQHPNRVLKEFIENLLKYIIDEKDLHLYVQPKAMELWEQSFTPEFTNPFINNEDQEYGGDRILKVVNPIYLMERLPSYTESDVSKTDMLIMEKKTQSDLAIEMGLTKYLKSDKSEVNVSIYGDLFEAFFGALDEVAELIMEDLGLIVCYDMNAYIFNQNAIPKHLKEGDIKMNVEQIFMQLGLPQPHVLVAFNEGLNHVTITLTEEQIGFFKSYGIFVNPIVGRASGKSKNITVKNAYSKVKKALEAVGVNDQFIAKIKEEKVAREAQEVVPKELIVFDLKDLVTSMISPIITNAHELEKYLDKDAMGIWKAALDQENKVTKYQFLGEVILKGLVPRYLMKLHKDDIMYNKQKYNDILANIQKNYDIYVVDFELLKSKYYFESFFGAFFVISDNLLRGVGLINSYRLVKNVIGTKTPEDFSYKHPKMYFDQLLVPFFNKGQGKLIVQDTHEAGHHVYDLYLSDDQYNFLRSQGFKIGNKLIGHAEGNIKKQVEREAYNNARIYLDKYGVNEQWSFMKKESMKFDDPAVAKYKKLLEDKNKLRGFDYIYFRMPIKTTTQDNGTMQLIGISGGKKELLSSVVYNKNDNNAAPKVQLIKDYLALPDVIPTNKITTTKKTIPTTSLPKINTTEPTTTNINTTQPTTTAPISKTLKTNTSISTIKANAPVSKTINALISNKTIETKKSAPISKTNIIEPTKIAPVSNKKVVNKKNKDDTTYENSSSTETTDEESSNDTSSEEEPLKKPITPPKKPATRKPVNTTVTNKPVNTTAAKKPAPVKSKVVRKSKKSDSASYEPSETSEY